MFDQKPGSGMGAHRGCSFSDPFLSRVWECTRDGTILVVVMRWWRMFPRPISHWIGACRVDKTSTR